MGGAFYDGHCPKCGRRIGWAGRASDRPPCPRCGHQLPPEKLEAADRELERVRAKLLAEQQREWDERTPVQEAAWAAGREAYDPAVPAYKVASLSPHRQAGFVDGVEEERDLHGWWMRGWHNAENEARS